MFRVRPTLRRTEKLHEYGESSAMISEMTVFLLWEEVSDQTGKEMLVGVYSSVTAAGTADAKIRDRRTRIAPVPLDTEASNSWGW
jgi:hypothetical protein